MLLNLEIRLLLEVFGHQVHHVKHQDGNDSTPLPYSHRKGAGRT
jgi:hypothetical protein